MESRSLTTGKTPDRRFLLEILPNDDSIFSVGFRRLSIDGQLPSPSYDNLENDLIARLLDVSYTDYKLSFESFQRLLEANPLHSLSSASC